VIAVTGLAGHAFESWRNRETHQMWLKDFLPYNVKNIRIMTYGYDSRLVGHDGAVEMRVLDFQRHFIQQLQNARNSVLVCDSVSTQIVMLLVLTVFYEEKPADRIHWT
jgi:hypothetical protein